MPLNPGESDIKRVKSLAGVKLTLSRLYSVVMVLSLLVFSSVFAQERALRSSLNTNTITVDETVTLTIVARGLDEELDASSLEKDFEVVGRSSSRELSTVTGSNNRTRTTSIVTWALELIPRDVGVFTVPAVRVGDLSSQIHTLTVNELPRGASRELFVEASVDTQQPWVQSQVLMSVKVFQAIDIVDGGLDVPSGRDLVVERIGEDTRTTVERDGRAYSVTERRFALFPQRSGEIVIEPITLSVSVPAQRNVVRGFFSPTRKITRRTERISLNVKPRPDSGGAWWFPAKSVQLESQWVGGADQASVDQPLTRRIVMRASGVADTQLPDINIPAIDGMSLYAEQPERAMGADNNGLVAEQVVNWALIPQRPGNLTVPAIRVEWFNTVSGQVETAELPAETIVVAAARTAADTGNGASSGEDTTDALSMDNRTGNDDVNTLDDQQSAVDTPDQSLINSSDVRQNGNLQSPTDSLRSAESQVEILKHSVDTWRNVALIAGALWVVSALFFFWRRTTPWAVSGRIRSAQLEAPLGAVRQVGTDSLQRLMPLASIGTHCKSGDLAALRLALLEWSARQWPDNPPLTLDALVKRLPEGSAKSTVADVNSALYSRRGTAVLDASWQERLVALPDQIKQALASDSTEVAPTGKTVISRNSGTGLPPL